MDQPQDIRAVLAKAWLLPMLMLPTVAANGQSACVKEETSKGWPSWPLALFLQHLYQLLREI